MGRRTSNQPSAFELKVLKALWENGPGTVERIGQWLGDDVNVTYTTIATILTRMHGKGLIERRKEGRAWVYTPMAQRTETEQSLLQGLIDRVFGGSPKALMLSLLRRGDLSKDEIEELSRLAETEGRAVRGRKR